MEITVSTKEGPTLKIKFRYYTQLKIVGVHSDVVIPNNITGRGCVYCGGVSFCIYRFSGNTAREVLQGDSIVGELVEGDSGTDSPNPVNHYQLRKVGLNSYASVVHKLGYAYSWAQKVCGLDYLITDVTITNNNIYHTNLHLNINFRKIELMQINGVKQTLNLS